MRRFFIDEAPPIGESIEISGDFYHHIFDVCRQKAGSRFELITSRQRAHLVEVLSVDRKRGQVRVLEIREIPPLRKPYLHLVLSLPKPATFESIVEKAVELGVQSIHPVFSDFSFFRSESSFPFQKRERWLKIVMGATQQTGRGDLMQIHLPQKMQDFFKTINWTESQMGLFAYEGESTLSIKNFLATHKEGKTEDIWIFVGSEGGFSSAEVEMFKKQDLEPVTLGDQVLRVETACVALVSILKYEFEGSFHGSI